MVDTSVVGRDIVVIQKETLLYYSLQVSTVPLYSEGTLWAATYIS